MPSLTPFNIASILDCKAEIVQNNEIKHLLTDSRRLIHAKNAVFFALKGAHHDGHLYIKELMDSGVCNFVVEHIADLAMKERVNFYVVENSVEALQRLAASNRNNFLYPVIGITGSNGKTIVKEWAFQMLSGHFNIIRNPRSYNSQIGVPLSVWNMEAQNEIAIFEAGISQKGEMARLEKVIKPTIGIFTNIGDAHQENFSNVKEKIEEKIQLFKHAKTLIYCSDQKMVDEVVRHNLDQKDIKLFNWALEGNALLNIEKIKLESARTTIFANYKGEQISIKIPFTDKGSIENAIHLWCLQLLLGIEQQKIADKMLALVPVEMRLEQKSGIHNCTLINDSYNSDMNSLVIAIDFLNQQHQHSKKTVIISDILQSGKKNDELYEEVANILREKKIDEVIGIGEEISKNRHLFDSNTAFYGNTNGFLDSLDPYEFKDRAILLKGARTFQFEKIEKLLQQQVHETILQIDLDAVIHNLNYFRGLIKPQTKMMAMVKAISYGSGTFEIAHLLKFHHIDYLGVAYIDEGIELRKAGVATPIMVMNPELEHMDQLIEYGLEPEIYSVRMFEEFDRLLFRKGIKNHPCHIKLDTGMHRLGFMKEDIPIITSYLKENSRMEVRSIFSHLAASDDPSFDELTRKQILGFEEMSSLIMNEIPYPVLRHILNSSGIARFSEAQYDMVRLGIGLYGFAANSEKKLKNVFTLKTTISQIKKIQKGESVGYNPKQVLEKDTIIGIIAIGYADGFNRKLGNGVGKVIVKGKLLPITGNVCMDMCMIDLTDISDVREGDEAVIFGDDHTASNMAEQLDTIPYEVITNISERIKRIYYKE